jgi:hypothetical protein
MSTFFITSGAAGANLDGTTTDQRFALGTRVTGNNGTTWFYVQADGAIDDNDVVTVDENFQATPATIATTIDGNQLAFAQNAFADNEYGFVAVNGPSLTVAVSGTSTVNVAIYIGTVSGHLSTTASSATVAGVAIQTASSTSTGTSATAIVTWPKILQAGV